MATLTTIPFASSSPQQQLQVSVPSARTEKTTVSPTVNLPPPAPLASVVRTSQQPAVPLQSLTQSNSAATRPSRPPTQSSAYQMLPSQDERSKKPWKYEGYPGFCRVMASSGDAFILRRFNKLNARVILSMQDEIVQLETELDALDQKCVHGPVATERSSSLRYDPQPRRKEIVLKLRTLLKEYNEYILAYSDLRSRSPAQDYQVDNVQNWFFNNPKAIDTDEQKFASTGEDLIPIIPQSKSWLRLGIERINPKVLSKLFPSKSRPDRVTNKQSFYANSKMINAAETFVIVVLGLAVLLAPLWWLNKISGASPTDRLWVISGCVIFFTASLASATVEKPFEVLIGTAGYAAVLMVFMQQQSPSPGV